MSSLSTKLNLKNVLKRKKLLLLIGLLLLCVQYYIQSDFDPDLYFLYWGPLEDVSCHYSISDDGLQAAEDPSYKPSSKSIFFHETSCKGDLHYRQACAVESASIMHPDWEIHVLFSAPVKNTKLELPPLSLLKRIKNIKLARVHVVRYAVGTPLQKMVESGVLNRTQWRISHASDVLRYLTLYKFGGIYLDLDVIVVKSLAALTRNWSARESNLTVSSGSLAFSKDKVGRDVADAVVRDIERNFRGDKWGHNGPGAITRVLKRRCSTSEPSSMSAVTCNGFEVYGPQFFYPIPWPKSHVYFEPGELNARDAYIHHIWGSQSKKYNITRNSPFARLAKKYCPTVYKTFKKDFGAQ